MIETSERLTFFDELKDVLVVENARRGKTEQISFRKAIVEGMGLPDSFASKMKSGQYKPTLERLITLSNFLGVHPSRFPSNSRRMAIQAVTEDERFIRLFVLLSSQTPKVYNILVDGILAFAEKMLRGAMARPKTAA
jgi:hypothetical protein